MSEPTKPGIEFYGGYQVYSESGVDLTLLRENLKRSFEERLEANIRNLPFLHALRESGRKNGGETVRRFVVPDFAAVLRQLGEQNVEFVVVGGFAMIAQGASYQTLDLDLCYSRTDSALVALAAAFLPWHPRLRGAPPDLPFRLDTPTLRAGLNFTLTTDLGDIDLLGEIAGVGQYPQVLAQSEERHVLGMRFRVLTLDGLIAAKRAAGRPKDRNHLSELENLKNARDAAP